MPDRRYPVHPLAALVAVSLLLGALWGAPANGAALVRQAEPAGPVEGTPPAWQAEPDEEEQLVQGPHPRRAAGNRPVAPSPATGQARTERQSYHVASRGLLAARTLIASWYGVEFEGLQTANGETFRKESLTAAHRSLPFGTVLRLTNVHNGRSVEVRVNDRGPWVAGRDLDLSEAAFRALAPLGAGVITVQAEVVSQ